MGKFIDLAGDKYGRLTVMSRAENVGERTAWLCECDCGNRIVATSNCLRTGRVKSCGCLNNESRASRARKAGMARGRQMLKHGHSKERLYPIWKSMKQRCSNPRDRYFKDYGGRGICVCKEWSDDYEAFRDWAMSSGYDPDAPFGECTLDRINVDGNYEPCNCRWVDEKTQANNRRPRKAAEKS